MNPDVAFAMHRQNQAQIQSEKQEKLQRLFKGLQETRNRVEQVLIEDSKYPDLFEQLSNQSEPQNYFFEPYASQWRPQIVKKGAQIPIPPVIASSLEETKTITLSGLLTSIDHAWTSIDNRVFLWNYKKRGNFAVFEFDQAVVSVGLCPIPASGVFTDKVHHLLVVATSVEVILVAVLYENNDPNNGSLKLQRTKLSVSTDNCIVRKIVCSSTNGRIFFGGSDGALYEFQYGPDDGSLPFFNKPCRKISYLGSLANYLPSFLVGLTSTPGKILEMVLDEERNVLYALHEAGVVNVYDLGISGNELNHVTTLNLLSAGVKYARENRRTRVSCPDERIFQSANMQIASLCVVPRKESAFINLVAVSSNGIRFYLTIFSRSAYTVGNHIPKGKRPTRLDVVYIRLPPPAISLSDAPPYHAKEGMQPGYVPGKSPSTVHGSFHCKGVFLLVDGGKDQHDHLVGITHDPITSSVVTQTSRKPTVRESISLDSCNGKVFEVAELVANKSGASSSGSGTSQMSSKRSFEDMSNSSNVNGGLESIAIVGELASQYSEPSRHFLCLTNSGIQVYKKIRPIDQLHRALLLSRGSELKSTLAPFVRSFGEVQVCCMLIALACGLSSDAFATDGTNGFSTIGVKSDDYLYSCAVQGIFECGQVAVTEYVASRVEPTDTRIVMTTDMEMSYQHDGLIMFVCRVMRPLWYSKSIGRRVITRSSSSRDRRSPSISYELEYSREQLEEIREVLFQLRQLMEGTGPYAVSISNSAVLEQYEDVVGASSDSSRVAELASRYQRQRTEDQLRREKRLKAEQRSLYFVYEMILRSIEGISLLRTCLEMNVPLEEKAARMSFSEFICSSEGTVAARDMIKSLIKSRGTENSSEFLIRQIREECPAFFSVADLWQYQGYQSLTTAKMSIPSGKKQHLKESLNQFLSSCYMWTTEDSIEVLQNICEDYAMLGFYEGVVKLSLACAKNFIEENFENSKLGSASLLKLRRSCFACILLILQRLLGEEEIESNGTMNMKTQKKQRRVEANPEDSIEKMVSLDEDTKKNALEQLFHFALVSKDQEFHELLYSWLYQNGHKKLLTRLRSPFLEEFLKQQDQELLIKLYMDQKKYLVAAKVWWNRAHETDDNILENNPDLNKRQYYVSKALGCLKSTEEMVSTQKETSSTLDAIKEVSDVLDVLQLQMRILNSLEQSTSEMEASATLSLDKLDERKNNIKELTYKVFDASTLYNNFAAKYDMWTECLYIIHTCNSEEPEIVSSLWRKIIYSLIPTSSSNSDFNVWRADHCEFAGLSTQSFSSSSFESGAWIGQLQCKLLRLGKSFYNDAGGAQSTNVFPVGFLAKELERISSWFVRLTQTNQNQKEAFASSIETSALTWVLKTFLDIGVPHRIVLSYYERMYHEQGTLNWVTHILSSIYVIITLWKKNAMSPRAGREALEEFAAACPHLVDCCEEFITELKAIPLDQSSNTSLLLDQFRRLKNEILQFRSMGTLY